jgi:8-oxo-dGTP diphosphatase
MIRRISVRAIVLHEGKLLCVRLKPYNEVSNSMGDAWCLPGGGLDEGESVVDGVKREMLEETGIEPTIGNLLYVQQFSHGDKDYLEFFFHATNATDFLNIDLSKTTHGGAEIEKIDFVDPATTPLLPKFLMTEDLVAQATGDNPPKFFATYTEDLTK